jgi:hypothetical protein
VGWRRKESGRDNKVGLPVAGRGSRHVIPREWPRHHLSSN